MTTGRLTLAKKQELAAIARHLIDHEQYLILATADVTGGRGAEVNQGNGVTHLYYNVLNSTARPAT